jgi:hypothetical protein
MIMTSPESVRILTNKQITKAVDISIVPADPGSMLPYKLDIKGPHTSSEHCMALRLIRTRQACIE